MTLQKVRIFCQVKDGALIALHEPYTGTSWKTEKGSVERAGSYYQETSYTDVAPDHPILRQLPENCWVE